jgi:hypothetical protein
MSTNAIALDREAYARDVRDRLRLDAEPPKDASSMARRPSANASARRPLGLRVVENDDDDDDDEAIIDDPKCEKGPFIDITRADEDFLDASADNRFLYFVANAIVSIVGTASDHSKERDAELKSEIGSAKLEVTQLRATVAELQLTIAELRGEVRGQASVRPAATKRRAATAKSAAGP